MLKIDDYTKEAQRLADEYARHFHAPVVSMDDVNFADHSLLETSRQGLETIDDRNAERLQKQWIEDAKIQAETYAAERNAGRQGRAYITEEEKSIRDGLVSWLRRQKMRGHFGGQKALDKT